MPSRFSSRRRGGAWLSFGVWLAVAVSRVSPVRAQAAQAGSGSAAPERTAEPETQPARTPPPARVAPGPDGAAPSEAAPGQDEAEHAPMPFARLFIEPPHPDSVPDRPGPRGAPVTWNPAWPKFGTGEWIATGAGLLTL